MNNLTLQHSMQVASDIARENKKSLKQIFNGKINGSFLIKIKNLVITELGDRLFQFMPLPETNAQIVTGNVVAHEYDICRMIVGTHRHHSIFLTKEGIKNNENSLDYQKKLVKEVIEKIRLHSLSNQFFSPKQLLTGDEFVYFPVPYELFALCIRCHHIINNTKTNVLVYNMDVINNALAALTLMEKNLLSNAYPLCRGMIEQYFKLLMLQKHPECVESFSKFGAFEIEQSCCSQEYPEEFNHLFEKRKQGSSRSKVDFLHYGWLDDIPAYTTMQSNRYSLYGIIEYLQDNADDKLCDGIILLSRLYKECHGYAHGSSVHVIYPLLQYFELSVMLYYVVRDVFMNLNQTVLGEMSDFDKNLISQLDRDFEELDGQYRMKSTEMFKFYYNN